MEFQRRPNVIIPQKSVESVVIDLDTGNCVVTWSDETSESGFVIEINHGPHGTWMVIVLDSQPNRTLCISQSAKMQPSCFFYDEPPVIPESTSIFISEEELETEFVSFL